MPRLHRTVLRLALGILCACLREGGSGTVLGSKGCLVTEFSPSRQVQVLPSQGLALVIMCMYERMVLTLCWAPKGLLVAEFSCPLSAHPSPLPVVLVAPPGHVCDMWSQLEEWGPGGGLDPVTPEGTNRPYLP